MATVEMKVYTGTNGATENPTTGSANNFNLLDSDVYDSTNTKYINYDINIPSSGSNYSYERILRFSFSGVTTLTSIKVYASGLSLPTGCVLNAGVASSATTPITTVSSVAVSSIPTTLGTALDITPTGGITTSGYTKYLYLQLVVPSTVTKYEDIGDQTITLSYE